MKSTGSFWSKLIPLIPIFVLCLVLFFLSKRLAGVFIPIALAVLLAYMLDPLVDFVQKHLVFIRNKTRLRAVQIVFISAVIVLGVVIVFVVPTVVSNVADIIEKSGEIVPKINLFINNYISDEHMELKRKLLSFTESAADKIAAKLDGVYNIASTFSLFGKISEIIVGGVTTVVLTYYFLRDKKLILNGFFGIFPYNWRQQVSEIANELGMISAKFIQGQVFVAFIVGTLEMLGLFALKVPYCVFLGIIGGVSNMIPYFGPFLGAVLPVLTALMISPERALWVLVLFLLVQQIDNHFISPKIIEGNLGIHPVTVIIVIFVGQEFFGLWGIVAAVPIYATIKCLLVRSVKLLILGQGRSIEM